MVGDPAASLVERIRARMRERHQSLRRTAALAGLDAAFLSRILGGTKPLPVHRLEAIADALGYVDAERADFLRQAHIALAPPEVQQWIRDLEEECERLRRRLAKG